jgi:Holliday junction resolvase RusA-like endonuclease
VILIFRAYGIAQPKGSTRAFVPRGWTRPIITDSNRSLKAWQQLVSEAASQAMDGLPDEDRALIPGGVRLSIAFYLPRPQSLAKRIRQHCKAPDVDKCARSVLDALTHVAYHDDAQVVELLAVKRYAGPTEVPCAVIRVEPAPETVDLPVVSLSRSLFEGDVLELRG